MGTLSNFLRTFAIILIAILLVILFFSVVVYIGWQKGDEQRGQFVQATLTYKIERQRTLTLEDMGEKRYDRAKVRIDWLMTQQPMDPLIVQWQSTIESAQLLEERPTETPTLTPTLPIPTLVPTGTPPTTLTPSAADIEKRFKQITKLTESKKWEEAISAILTFQIENPDYKRFETDKLLYESYVEAGFQATNGDQVSLGISYFELAAKLGKLPENAKSQLYYAELYQQAISYTHIRWDYTIANYREICAYQPNFHNACYLVYQSQLKAGTQYVKSSDGCSAIGYLQEAYNYDGLDSTVSLLGQAVELCSVATVTPIPTELWELYGSPVPPTSTIEITLTRTPTFSMTETIEVGEESETAEPGDGTPTLEPSLEETPEETPEETAEATKEIGTPEETPEETAEATKKSEIDWNATSEANRKATATPDWNATSEANRKATATPNWNATQTPNWNATATKNAQSNQP